MTEALLGRPVREALSSLPQDAPVPEIVETAAPLRGGQPREGTLRIVAVRGNTWIAARFRDGLPERKDGQAPSGCGAKEKE